MNWTFSSIQGHTPDKKTLFFIDSFSFSNESIRILKSNIGINILKSFLIAIQTTNSLSEIAKIVQKETDCIPKEFWSVVRISLTNATHGPSLDMIITIYGEDKVKSRINDALKL